MDEAFWDKTAPKFEMTIFNTLANDKNKTITKYIHRFARGRSVACDFGCGIGRYLKILSRSCATVYAIDFSSRCLKLASKSNETLDNIVYIHGDLSEPKIKLPKTHFALSVNVLIMPSSRQREVILNNISRSIVRGGYFLLVVPSLESALYSYFRLQEWNRESGSTHSGMSASSLTPNGSSAVSIIDGMLYWGKTLTKHFLREELIVLLRKARLSVISVEKVEYPWTIEFTRPPTWMKTPYPWDWLLLCRKK